MLQQTWVAVECSAIHGFIRKEANYEFRRRREMGVIALCRRIIIALKETIRIMREIDEIIDAHGGWPAAFYTADGNKKRDSNTVASTTPQ